MCSYIYSKQKTKDQHIEARFTENILTSHANISSICTESFLSVSFEQHVILKELEQIYNDITYGKQGSHLSYLWSI